jgi:hypothetical protein
MAFFRARDLFARDLVVCALAPRAYRLIDSLLQPHPHPHLDVLYESIEEAIRDAIAWVEGLGPDAVNPSIGLDVSTNSGDWRTIRQPFQLLCPLPLAV